MGECRSVRGRAAGRFASDRVGRRADDGAEVVATVAQGWWPMSLFTRGLSMPDAGQQIADRTGARTGGQRVTDDTARRHSAVWACRRLRADLLSTMPVDAYRRVGDYQVEVTKPPVLLAPGGARVDMHEWLWMSQDDLDGHGKAVGIITAVDGLGLPARIELQDLSTVAVRGTGSEITEWRIGGARYEPHQIWHE